MPTARIVIINPALLGRNEAQLRLRLYPGSPAAVQVDNAALDSVGCYADCDPGTGVGVLDIFDFLCFQNAYDAGCP